MARICLPMAGLVMMVAGCQSMPTSAQEAGGAGWAGVRTSAPVVTWYTHEGAEGLYRAAKYEDAAKMCTEAVAQIEKAKGKTSWELGEPLIDLATITMRQAKFAEAKAAIDRASGVLNKDEPAQALLVGRLAINKGWRLYTFVETAAAEKIFAEGRKLLEAAKPEKGAAAKDLAELINNEALMLEETAGELDDDEAVARSRRMLLQSWQMRRKLCGEESPETAESLNNLGMHLLFHGKAGDVELAQSTLKKSLEMSKKMWGENHPDTAMAHTNVALVAVYAEEFEEAETELKAAMPVSMAFFGKAHPDRSYQLSVLGRVQMQKKKFTEAEASFEEAVGINEKVYGKNHPNVASSLQYLSSLYEVTGEAAKQEAVARRIEKLSGGDL